MSAAKANPPKQQQKGPSGPDPKTIRGFIEEDQADQLVKTAEKLGHALGENKVSTNQVRNIFSSIKRLEMREQQKRPDDEEQLSSTALRELLLLKPRLAYTTARQNNQNVRANALEPLQEAVTAGIDATAKQNNQKALSRLSAFYEAIVAYHQYYHRGR